MNRERPDEYTTTVGALRLIWRDTHDPEKRIQVVNVHGTDERKPVDVTFAPGLICRKRGNAIRGSEPCSMRSVTSFGRVRVDPPQQPERIRGPVVRMNLDLVTWGGQCLSGSARDDYRCRRG